MADPKIVLTAVDKTSAAFASATANLKSLGDRALSVTGVLGGLGASLSAGAAFAWAKSITDGVDALNDLSDATGASIENISALEDVAVRTGTSMDSVGAALTKFNLVLKDAKPGSDAEAAMKALNLNIKELQSLDPAEALRQTAVALSGFADDGNKARLVHELFGKFVKQVAPFLKDLAEKGALVATVTTDQAKAAEAFNKEIFSLQKNVTDLGRSLAGPLVEGINAFIEKMRVARRENTGFFASIESMAAKERAKSDAMFTGSWYQGNAGRGTVNPALVRPSANFDGATKEAKPTAAKSVRQLDLSNNALSSYIEMLELNIQKTQDLSAQEEALIFLRKKGTGATIDEAAAVLSLAVQIDKAKQLKIDQAEALKQAEELDANMGAADKRAQDSLKRLLDATPGAELGRARADMILLTQEFEAGHLSEEKYLEAVTARAGITTRELEETVSIADQLGLSFSSAFEDAIVGGKGLSSVIKGLGDDILRITIRKSITEPLGGFFSSAVGGLFGGFKAEGGPVSAGVPYIVGERGPEWFVPGQSGGIIPNGAKGGSSQPIVINISNTVGEIVTPSQLRQNNRALVQQIQSGLGRSVQYGGAMS